jgi:uroporphyrin-3 C-methyltransferase
VIDVDPENGAATGVEAETISAMREPARQKNSAVAWVALLLALAAVAGAAILGVFGYQQLGRLNQEAVGLSAEITRIAESQAAMRATIDQAVTEMREQQGQFGEQRELLAQQREAFVEARSAFRQQEQQLADENLRWHEREAELRAVVADVHQRVGRSGTQWILIEAEYLMRIAADRLVLARDVETAQVALELADQRLRDTGDPGWAGVRQQVARDIAALTAFDEPDLAGLSAQIAAMIDQIPQLRIARSTVGPERRLPQTEPRATEQRSWETLLDDLWAGFKNSVRIRERDAPIEAMLAPEHEFFLYENLKLHLEAARLGLARLDPQLFGDSLGTASAWLTRYFAVNEEPAIALSAAIRDLKALDIVPPLPDISRSLRALKARQSLMVGMARESVGSQ